MSPQHHPSENLLAAYSVGALANGHAVVVATHLEHCAPCRQANALWEAVGGRILESLPPAEMAEDDIARAMARLDEPEPQAMPPPVLRTDNGLSLPRAVALYGVGRRRWITPFLWRAAIPADAGEAQTYLLGLKAGKSLPRHKHRGLETICVLKGAFADGDVYGPGDFLEIEGEHDHQPVVTRGGDCICVISSDGPPKIQGLVRWAVRSFVGQS